MVPLSQGDTWIQETGPASGQPLLLIHGATVPHWSFERLVPHLAAAGFRVLCFDLYGHGQSAKPRVDYTVTLFRQQAQELLAVMDFTRPVAVLGYSLGAAIAADLCRHNPATINGLVLVAPLWNFSDHSRWSGMIRNPLTSPITLRHLALPALRIRRRRRYTAIGLKHLGERFGDESRGPGFGHAVLSMERCGTLGCQRERYRALGWFPFPRLLISADEDRMAPPAHVDHVRSLIQPCQNRVFKGREHNLMLTDPARVSESISAFLLEPPAHPREPESSGQVPSDSTVRL